MTDTNSPAVADKPGFQLSEAFYQKLKFTAMILLPALSTLYFTLATVWEWPNTTQVIGSSTAVDTFLGILLGISTKAYNSSDARFDGHVVLEPNEEGTLVKLSVDPQDLVGKDQITLKVGAPPA